jgi:hypothetical protein
MRMLVLATAGVAAALIAAVAAGAPPSFKLVARLTAAQEVPKQVVANPRGTGRITATVSGSTLHWRLTFAHLTGPAVAAQIHSGKKGVSGPIVVPLCRPCRTGQGGSVKLAAEVALGIRNGKYYVNVDTRANPNGEIRGQVVPVG